MERTTLQEKEGKDGRWKKFIIEILRLFPLNFFWNGRMSDMLNIHVTYSETKKLTSCQKGIRFLEFRDWFKKRLLCYRRGDHIQEKRWRYADISQTSMNCHVQLKIVKFTILRKERKTTDLYIEILIVQANFFVVFALLSFFRNLWNCDQFAHNFLITCVQLIFFGC